MMAMMALVLLGLGLAVVHVWESWEEPGYPHSGFGPDCPLWVGPWEGGAL